MRYATLAIALSSLAGCDTPVETACTPACAEGYVCQAGACVPGGGGPDMALSDGGGGPCKPACGGLTPYCNGAGHCVGCTMDAQCPTGKYCKVQDDAHAACVIGCDSDDRCGNGKCCNSQCVDVSADANNCGACGKACGGLHARAACAGGQCVQGACDPGWGDCDGDPANGCEANLHVDVANCTACGASCDLPNTIVGCSDGCYVSACKFGFDDCNGDPMDGCEQSVLTDPNNCGACGNSCAGLPNAQANCVNGNCVFGACNAGFADCDGVAQNGCEVNVNFDPKNCGGCGKVCPMNTPSCGNGTCTVGLDFGPMHTFVNLTTDHYITQGCCSVNCNPQQDKDLDAQFFCKHFYGDRLGLTCTPKPGYLLAQTPNPAYVKMHKNGGCTMNGSDIPNTMCSNGPCKIGNWNESTNGLTNLVCHCM